jgi:hypothetical protein
MIVLLFYANTARIPKPYQSKFDAKQNHCNQVPDTEQNTRAAFANAIDRLLLDGDSHVRNCQAVK